MKKSLKTIALLMLLALLSFRGFAQDMQTIKPNDEQITYQGAYFISKTDDKAIINRIAPKTLEEKECLMNPLKANTQTGVSISLATNSSKIIFHLQAREDSKNRSCIMAIYKNGILFKDITLNPKKTLEPIIIENPNGAQWAEWKLLLPPFYGLNFLGLEIEKESDYKTIETDDQKVYVAIGNSITHGAGQKASYQTYPYLLAEKKGWELYNLGVGGSKISWPIAEMLKDKKIDIITILWGYNDWNGGYILDKEIIPQYTKLLKILLESHPKTKIYCILPTITKRETPKKGNLTIDQIRLAEEEIIKEFQNKGYKNIFIIKGNEITELSDLKDLVHFSVDGAAKYAVKLNEIIQL